MNWKYEIDRRKSIFILPCVVVQMLIFACWVEYGRLVLDILIWKSTSRTQCRCVLALYFFPVTHTYQHTSVIHNHKWRSIRQGEKNIFNVSFPNPAGMSCTIVRKIAIFSGCFQSNIELCVCDTYIVSISYYALINIITRSWCVVYFNRNWKKLL